jgi:curved DNA-binding protein CbpA
MRFCCFSFSSFESLLLTHDRYNKSILQIKASFRELARRYHPDKDQTREINDSGEKFKRIREAYEILCDKEMRARFDAGECVRAASGGTVAEVDLGVTLPLRTVIPRLGILVNGVLNFDATVLTIRSQHIARSTKSNHAANVQMTWISILRRGPISFRAGSVPICSRRQSPHLLHNLHLHAYPFPSALPRLPPFLPHYQHPLPSAGARGDTKSLPRTWRRAMTRCAVGAAPSTFASSTTSWRRSRDPPRFTRGGDWQE